MIHHLLQVFTKVLTLGIIIMALKTKSNSKKTKSKTVAKKQPNSSRTLLMTTRKRSRRWDPQTSPQKNLRLSGLKLPYQVPPQISQWLLTPKISKTLKAKMLLLLLGQLLHLPKPQPQARSNICVQWFSS